MPPDLDEHPIRRSFIRPRRLPGSVARLNLRRLQLVIPVVIAGLLAWWLIEHFTAQKPVAAAPPPIPVMAGVARARDIPALEPAVGTVLSLDVVNVMPQVNGRITKVYFTQGEVVKKGQKLFEIDPRPYRAALEQAQGELIRDRAMLAEARMDLVRYQKLASQNSVALQTAQDQVYVVGQDEGTVKLDEGNVAAAAVNLSYCEITAPVDGLTGVLQVELGNYVQAASAATTSAAQQAAGSGTSSSGSASGVVTGGTGSGGGTTPLVTITQLKPIYVSFNVPENQLGIIRENQAKGALSVAAYTPAGKLLATGKLTLINNQVATTTGTIMLEATFANDDERLWPNQFVSVELTEFMRMHAVEVPASAVMTGPTGQYVYVIGAGDKVSRDDVEVVATQQGIAVIGKGLTGGEQVVTDGQYRLDDGAVVSIRGPKTSAPGPQAAMTGARRPASATDPKAAGRGGTPASIEH
jgi:membrane fusion protein, multidrug efflux system